MTKRAMRRARARAGAAPTQKQEVIAPIKVTREHVALFAKPKPAKVDPFALPEFPRSATPTASLAQDDALSATGQWAAQVLAAGQIDPTLEGQRFLGYSTLSAMAQRPEYRRIVETIATEMTRKWIRLVNRKGDERTQDRLDALTEALERLNVRDAFRKAAEGDGFFGRGHLYIALDGDQVGEELRAPIGNGRDAASRQKVRKGKLLRIQPVEAVWAYPQAYNTNNPLDADWYVPQVWFVQGKAIHRSRLLTFVGREVPDLLKSAYAFGGLAMTQMAQPYVANWLRTREDVSDLIAAFSVSGVKGMGLADMLATGGVENLQNRIDLFVNARDNRGFMALGEGEDFFNVSTPLGTLDKLQAQAQEQIASVCGIPLVKLLGVTPSGLNASSDGEVRVFYDHIHAYQEKLFGENLKRVLGFVQLSEFGDIDEDIGFEFEPLWQMSEAEKADVALKRTQAIMTAEPALPSDIALRELREMADSTGVFTQITDEDIDAASTEAPAPETIDPDADQPDGTEPLPDRPDDLLPELPQAAE
jgi:phage-related protein (TIGR01555 family)